MNEVTRLLSAAELGDRQAAEDLLPIVYEELRRLAASRLARESEDHTLQPTALVHEAWLRLVGAGHDTWDNRGHFFAAAAEAMRRILVERARRRGVLRQGGFEHRTELSDSAGGAEAPDAELLAVHEALDALAAEDRRAAELVKLRYYLGLSMPDAARAMGLPQRSAERLWTFARAWLRHALQA